MYTSPNLNQRHNMIPLPYTKHDAYIVFMDYVPKGKRKPVPIRFCDKILQNAQHKAWEHHAKNGGKYTRGYWINAELQIHNEHGIEMYSHSFFAQENELNLTMYNER